MKSFKVGAIFRAWATTPEELREVLDRSFNIASKANAMEVGGEHIFDRIVFLVPTDYDTEGTASALRDMFIGTSCTVEVWEAVGHHSCEVLNVAINKLKDNSVEFAAIISVKAIEYLTQEVLLRAEKTLCTDIKVVGIQIHELDPFHESPIENTFAIWNIEALLAVGGFESDNGAEEIAPLIRLSRKFGKSAALLLSDPSLRLVIRQEGDGPTHHEEVKKTKRERQELEAKKLGTTLTWLKKEISTL